MQVTWQEHLSDHVCLQAMRADGDEMSDGISILDWAVTKLSRSQPASQSHVWHWSTPPLCNYKPSRSAACQYLLTVSSRLACFERRPVRLLPPADLRLTLFLFFLTIFSPCLLCALSLSPRLSNDVGQIKRKRCAAPVWWGWIFRGRKNRPTSASHVKPPLMRAESWGGCSTAQRKRHFSFIIGRIW